MNDLMLSHLFELLGLLQKEQVDVTLGGGLSHYLRQTYLTRKVSPRYNQVRFLARSTQDIDIFLSSQIIIDHQKMDIIKSVLDELGYQAIEQAKYFQFYKMTEIGGKKYSAKIDLLAAPPQKNDDHVQIHGFRIKPKSSEGIHAYLTPEAASIDFGRVIVEVLGEAGKKIRVRIPSAYNFMILKLHAFADRKDRSDAISDHGRHHAFDIFATLCQMDKTDWDNAAEHYKNDGAREYLLQACQIRREYFSAKRGWGIIRIRENQGYRQYRDEYDRVLEYFIQDLAELFP